MKNHESKGKYVLTELINHLPFSIFGVVSGIMMVGLLTFIAIVAGGELLLKEASSELFHVFHPIHVLLSAVATTSMYWKHERSLLKAIIIGTLLPALFYLIFTFVVVGFKGSETPEIATFALGGIFVFMGIVAMFTSYLSLGNALQQNYIFDFKDSKKRAWFKATILPIVVFLLTQIFKGFFSFIRVISIGGVVSGGIIAILILIIHKRAEKLGDKKPEFRLPISKTLIIILSLIFSFGIISELFNVY